MKFQKYRGNIIQSCSKPPRRWGNSMEKTWEDHGNLVGRWDNQGITRGTPWKGSTGDFKEGHLPNGLCEKSKLSPVW